MYAIETPTSDYTADFEASVDDDLYVTAGVWSFTGATVDNDDGTIRVTLNGQNNGPDDTQQSGNDRSGWDPLEWRMVVRCCRYLHYT